MKAFERPCRFVCRHPLFAGALALAALALLVYGDALSWPVNRVISREDTDLAMGIFGLEFVFGELRHGNFVLWCPYLLSGYPIFAGFQSLQLYPPALLFLLLPVGPAVNAFIVLHVWLMGFGMHWWMLRRGLHPLAAVLSGALLMLGSTTTMQIYAGHITPLAAMTWAPFIFLALDGVLDEERAWWRWALTGVLFVALQIAGCFPQHLVYTALAAGLYFLARLAAARRLRGWSWRRCGLAILAASAMYGGAALLLAVQLLTSWGASKETARATALPFSFVSSLSFPPENFLTTIAPLIFGDDRHLPYWGRWYMWEMILFIGVSGLLLAVWGAWSSPRRVRWAWLGAGFVLLFIALGSSTPLLWLLYRYVPLFGSFRASARALFEVSLFLCALAGLGLDQLLRAPVVKTAPHDKRRVIFTGAALCLFLSLPALAFWLAGDGSSAFWERGLQALARSRQYFLPAGAYSNPILRAPMAWFVSLSLLAAAATGAVSVLLFHFASRRRFVIFLLAAFAFLEIAVFARALRQDFNLDKVREPALQNLLARLPERDDARFIKSSLNNLALAWRKYDMGGYESFRLSRYDEFIRYTQGDDPNQPGAALTILGYHPLYRMLRCRYAFNGETMQANRFPDALPHVLLVPGYSVVQGRDRIFAAMEKKSFDPRRTVILEEEPQPQPDQSAVGTARVVEEGTDYLIIEAQVDKPSLLLVTDNYSKGWKAWGLEGSGQREYSVLPANYVLRAIPLQAGHHRIRLEYLPESFVIGKWISIIALLVYLGLVGLVWRRSHTMPSSST